ncbi:MAG: MBOAT family O-acyltransferase, partial [Oscillospiraceae bacterium]
WAGAIAYTLQIYFDFSGYSDMAIGLGRMFGFHFNENFNQPYLAGSITDFWRRWHISLSTWFRDYVYIPLGGNRVKSTARLVFNLFVVWLCTGLWHGANWTFIIWGLGYFVLLCIEKFTHITDTKIFKKLGHFYTMFFVVMGWVLFRSEDINIAGNYFKGMFGFGGLQFVNELNLYDLRHYGVYFIIALLAVTPLVNLLKKKNDAVQISAKKNFGKSI